MRHLNPSLSATGMITEIKGDMGDYKSWGHVTVTVTRLCIMSSGIIETRGHVTVKISGLGIMPSQEKVAGPTSY